MKPGKRHGLVASLTGLMIVDATLTTMGMISGHGTELNPIWNTLFQFNLQFGLAVLSLSHITAPILFVPLVEISSNETQDRIVTVALVVLVSFYTYIVGRNLYTFFLFHGVI